MQKTLFIKLVIIAVLCLIFSIGLAMFRSVIYERQSYGDAVIAEIAEQHVHPQEVITPFIAIPTTITPPCTPKTANKAKACPDAYTKIQTLFADQTQATQDLSVSTNTYQRGIYHATSYRGELLFEQKYLPAALPPNTNTTTNAGADNESADNAAVMHWRDAKLIIPVSDLRGAATLPTVMLGQQAIKASYPQTPMLMGMSYVEVALPQATVTQLGKQMNTQPINITTNLPLSGISALSTVPTGQDFTLTMTSNWHAPNFIGKALPHTKSVSDKGFDASWQNQYLTIANNQTLSQCLGTPNTACRLLSTAHLDNAHAMYEPKTAINAHSSRTADDGYRSDGTVDVKNVRLNHFGVSFSEPNSVYLQTERSMKYALLLILISFGTFFLFEVIKSSRIHPIQYGLVGCALLTFYVLLLPLAEHIKFWQAYTTAASACVGLIGWYTYYVLGGIKRALTFTLILAGLYAAFYGILTTEVFNLLFGAVFCFLLLTCVMIMTRKIDWYKVA